MRCQSSGLGAQCNYAESNSCCFVFPCWGIFCAFSPSSPFPPQPYYPFVCPSHLAGQLSSLAALGRELAPPLRFALPIWPSSCSMPHNIPFFSHYNLKIMYFCHCWHKRALLCCSRVTLTHQEKWTLKRKNEKWNGRNVKVWLSMHWQKNVKFWG